MNVRLAVLISLLLVCACWAGLTEQPPEATPTRTLGPGEQWVPVAPDRKIPGVLVDCGGVGMVGSGNILTGSPTDSRLVWMMMADKRYELEWPVGYSARFTPQLELLDENGIVVGRGGTEPTGGCQMMPGIYQVELPTPK